MFRKSILLAPLGLLATLALTGLVGCGVAAQGHNMAGVRLFEQGQYPAAMTQFQHAVATQPENADGYYNLAATLHRIGTAKKDRNTLDQAENLYNQCLDRNPNHVECYRGLAVLLIETDRADKGFTLMKNWVASNPAFAEPRVELARLYEEFGDKKEATDQLAEAVRIQPGNARAYKALGNLREQSGDATQALANYERSLKLDKNQPQLAERVASLQKQAYSVDVTIPGGMRTVNTPTPKRY